MDQRDETPLAGKVELDGGYVGGSCVLRTGRRTGWIDGWANI